MSGDQPGEPEDTVPFTHRPYGSGEDDNPYVSPSGPAAQPSGPGFVVPGPPPPPSTSHPPYGAPQQPWQVAWTPTYGSPLPGSLDHKGATTALTLGIISVVSLVLALFCCVTIPGVLCAPFAWVIGAKARREIDAAPGVYGNRGAAQGGMVMGIVCTLLGALLILGFVALATVIGVTEYSLV